MKCVFSLALFCAIGAVAQLPPGLPIQEKEITYDKFNDVTLIKLRFPEKLEADPPGLGLGRFTVTPLLLCSGDVTSCYTVRDACLSFNSTGDRWNFSGVRELILLVDGKRMAFSATRSGDVSSYGWPVTFELVNAHMSYEELTQILHAKNVEGKLGDRTFKIAPEVLSHFADLFLLKWIE